MDVHVRALVVVPRGEALDVGPLLLAEVGAGQLMPQRIRGHVHTQHTVRMARAHPGGDARADVAAARAEPLVAEREHHVGAAVRQGAARVAVQVAGRAREGKPG